MSEHIFEGEPPIPYTQIVDEEITANPPVLPSLCPSFEGDDVLLNSKIEQIAIPQPSKLQRDLQGIGRGVRVLIIATVLLGIGSTWLYRSHEKNRPAPPPPKQIDPAELNAHQR